MVLGLPTWPTSCGTYLPLGVVLEAAPGTIGYSDFTPRMSAAFNGVHGTSNEGAREALSAPVRTPPGVADGWVRQTPPGGLTQRLRPCG